MVEAFYCQLALISATKRDRQKHWRPSRDIPFGGRPLFYETFGSTEVHPHPND
jgi:hypothetical protein